MRTLPTVAGAILLLVATASHAHRLDEYLQATTLSLEKDRVQANVRLIPGIAAFPIVLASIDTDSDGAISEAEQGAYAERVQRDLYLKIDGEGLRLRLIASTFPKIETLKEGLGEILLQFEADVPRSGSNRKLVFENHHQRAIATYLVNALVPRDEDIRIAAQNRNFDQSSYELHYAQAGASSASALPSWRSVSWGWACMATLLLLACVAVLWRRYIALGSVAKE